MPPLVILLGDDEPANARWTSRNRALAQALTLFEAATCSGCGQPLHESADVDGPDYSAEDYMCRGCAILSDAPSPNDEPGTKWTLGVTRR